MARKSIWRILNGKEINLEDVWLHFCVDDAQCVINASPVLSNMLAVLSTKRTLAVNHLANAKSENHSNLSACEIGILVLFIGYIIHIRLQIDR